MSEQFYICKGMSALAGPYDTTSPEQVAMLGRVIEDLKAGGIEHMVKNVRGGVTLYREGMILPSHR